MGKIKVGELFKNVGEFGLPGGYVFAPSYIQVVAIIALLFLLVLTLGQLRRRFIGWHVSGIMPGVLFGFVITLIVEGILVVGGRTILTELLGWRSAPKPIVNVLDAGRTKLTDVLGVTREVPSSRAEEKATVGSVLDEYKSLTSGERESLRSLLCRP